MRFRRTTIAILSVLASALIAGCASAPKTTTSHVASQIDTSAIAIANIRSWLAAQSLVARSMSVSGDITLEQSGESNSASFAMKSKRLNAIGGRVDSLSIEVTGPFGIKVARFIASPERYQFYDVLHGGTMSGATDTKSLEELTHLRGVSLPMMSDLIYGIAGSDLNSSDSLLLFSNGSTHLLVIRDVNASITEQLDLEGELPSDSSAGNLSLAEYTRWNQLLPVRFPGFSSRSPDVIVRFESPIIVNGISIPQHIMAAAGANKLTLDYTHIELNSPALTVRIKMPAQ